MRWEGGTSTNLGTSPCESTWTRSDTLKDSKNMNLGETLERPDSQADAPTLQDNDESSSAIRLDIWVRDPELVGELKALPEGRRREDFALGALKIGVLALRQAQGRIDTDAVRMEGDRLIANLA